jgi:hypothetical protein
MAIIKSDSADLTINADGASSNLKLQIDGVEKASISSAGAFTSTTIDATALTGALPAIDGANLTGVAPTKATIEGLGIAASSITGALPAIDGANLTGIAIPTLDSPSITGTLFVDSGSTVSHTISNWSDDVTYVITPTNCTVGSVNSSGVFVVTHTSGTPSYTIKATTDSLGLADSSVVTKNIGFNLTAPTISAPADVNTLTDVVYTITSTDSNDDKIILDMGSSNFNLGTVSPGSGTKSGNTVVVTGFTTGNPVVTIQFTAAATYSVTAKSVDTGGTYGDSPLSSADSITIIPPFSATGGTITTTGGYNYHTFTSSASGASGFVPNKAGTVEYLIVGGGSGAARAPNIDTGGAGAGGAIDGSATVSATSYNIVIGAGGASFSSGDGGGYSGANTTFNSLTAIGGGLPGYYSGNSGGIPANGNYYSGQSGGSGGGASWNGYNNTTYGVGTSGQGNRGGGISPGHNYKGNGGGGKGAVGADCTSSTGGAGGAGINWKSLGTYYAGGGGGGPGGAGGTGGGGNGAAATASGANGSVNTGGGGGGGTGTGYNTYPSNPSASGGSGVVIIRYAV